MSASKQAASENDENIDDVEADLENEEAPDEDSSEEEGSDNNDESDEETWLSDDERTPRNSLFDALAAAQEAEQRWKDTLPGSQYDDISEADRLPENFLRKMFEQSIKKPACKDEEEEPTLEMHSPGDNAEEANSKWFLRAGFPCLARWSEDNKYYPAKIVQVKSWKNKAIVKFCYYGDEEEVDISCIKGKYGKKKSKTKKSRKRSSDTEDANIGSSGCKNPVGHKKRRKSRGRRSGGDPQAVYSRSANDF